MPGRRARAGAGSAAGLAAFLIACAAPAGASAAESVPVTARLQIEPSVGASLALSLSDGLMVQIYLPGSPALVRSRPIPLPGMVLSFGDVEVVAESAVSLQVEHRAAVIKELGESGEKQSEGGALVIVAQFN